MSMARCCWEAPVAVESSEASVLSGKESKWPPARLFQWLATAFVVMIAEIAFFAGHLASAICSMRSRSSSSESAERANRSVDRVFRSAAVPQSNASWSDCFAALSDRRACWWSTTADRWSGCCGEFSECCDDSEVLMDLGSEFVVAAS